MSILLSNEELAFPELLKIWEQFRELLDRMNAMSSSLLVYTLRQKETTAGKTTAECIPEAINRRVMT